MLPSVLERILEELREDERKRSGTLAGERYRLQVGADLLSGDESLDEHRPQPVDELAEVDVVLAVLSEHLVNGRDGEYPIDRVLQRLARVDVLGPGLQPEE